MQPTIKAPCPFFGGKARAVPLVWPRFGQIQNYIEPCYGSGAMLLGRPMACGARPSEPWPLCFGTETVNDADGFIPNFLRAIAHDPAVVAAHADFPVSEIDLHARHRWLVDRREHVEQMLADPEWYDAKVAGWWVWGICQWIGTGWCPRIPAGVSNVGDLHRKIPHVGDAGRGIHRASNAHALPQKIPHVGDAGMGVHRPSPRLGNKMPFIASPAPDRAQHDLGIHGITHAGAGLREYFDQLAARLRRVRIICGDFERVLGDSVTWRHGMTGVFLDPPYADGEHAVDYAGGGDVWGRACAWCEANGDNPLLRICLAGYADTWKAPQGWQAVAWRTAGGYGSQGNARGRENAARETLWFSPACLDPTQEARDTFSRPIAVGASDYVGTMFEEPL